MLNLFSRVAERLLKLGPPLTRDLDVQRDLRVRMPDGVELLADRIAPRTGGDRLPVLLMRCPYGRRGLVTRLLNMRPLAERGYQVVIQSTRGTFGSGGDFDPLRRERDDGLKTLEWLLRQPWCGDSIVLYGPSYLGFVQWAMADALPPQVKAMIPIVTESALTLELLRPDGLSLETLFNWSVLTSVQEQRTGLARILGALSGRTLRAMKTLPLGQADVAATGRRIPYLQDVLVHDATSPRWAGIDQRQRVAQTRAPVSSFAGWYDIFLPGQLRDFETLQRSGRPARLTVGPWTHMDQGGGPVREALRFGLAHSRGEPPPPRKPVRLYVMGEDAWREVETWPPAGYAPRRFYLQPGRALGAAPPAESAADRYRYDPADPTPAVGGPRLGNNAGRADNTKLEARADVLVYSTQPLDRDVEVIGKVSAEIWFRSSLKFADVFVRLCDVDEKGRSFNVCDGLVSLRSADEAACVSVTLWPTAYLFKRGHRVRVQVSSGAFPRYARNSGTGESHATATALRAAEQQVFHDPARPSAIVLPVRESTRSP